MGSLLVLGQWWFWDAQPLRLPGSYASVCGEFLFFGEGGFVFLVLGCFFTIHSLPLPESENRNICSFDVLFIAISLACQYGITQVTSKRRIKKCRSRKTWKTGRTACWNLFWRLWSAVTSGYTSPLFLLQQEAMRLSLLEPPHSSSLSRFPQW